MEFLEDQEENHKARARKGGIIKVDELKEQEDSP